MKPTPLPKRAALSHASAILCAATVLAVASLGADIASAAKPKNWAAPKDRIVAQKITDSVMKKYPNLISVGLHGVPPGSPAKAYTMFGSSYPDRVGNADDPDDLLVAENGITILEPGQPEDKKFGYMAPLRDATGKTIGSIVLDFKNDNGALNDEATLKKGNAIRAEVEKQAPRFEDYFKTAK